MVSYHLVAYLYNYSSYLIPYGKCCAFNVLLINTYKLFLLGRAKCTTCSDFSSWFFSYSSSRVPKQQFCSAISIFVLRYKYMLEIHTCIFLWLNIVTLINFFIGLSLVVAQLSHIRLYCCLFVNLLCTFLRH